MLRLRLRLHLRLHLRFRFRLRLRLPQRNIRHSTKIICKTCFGHNSTQNERTSTIFGRIFTEFYVDSESVSKQDLKYF